MHKTLGRLVGAALLMVGGSAAFATGSASAAGQGGFACWSQGSGTCEYRHGVAHLTQLSDGSDGSGAGLYQHGKRTMGKSLERVSYGFRYNGTIAGGSPRINIWVDSTGDGAADFYLTVDSESCGGVQNTDGWASTENPGCTIYQSSGGGAWANWDALLADPATDGWRTARDYQPIIVADYKTDVRLWDIEFSVK